jgi:uncharacterized protein YjbI with pentapeptide repeats
MANEEHLALLRQGIQGWNEWRKIAILCKVDLHEACLPDAELSGANLSKADLGEASLSKANLSEARLDEADLYGADLSEANLFKADLRGANLSSANLSRAYLFKANLREADLHGANFREADLRRAALDGANLQEAVLRDALLGDASFSRANLQGADLSGANLFAAYLIGADLSGATLHGANLARAVLSRANLSGAKLGGAQLIRTDLCDAILTGSSVYGVSVWDIKMNERTEQQNLIITGRGEPIITVDNIKVAQFIYLLLNNEEIRDILETIGQKGVLILGRFTKERKEVLDRIRNRLRQLGFVPMMFDFERPTQRDFTETIKILAGLSRFIIADITNPASSPLELQATMPDYMIPFVPIIKQGEKPFAMFRDLKQKYGDWILDVLEYDSADNLIKVLGEAVVRPALEMSQRLIAKKAAVIQTRYVNEYVARGQV